MEPQLSAKYTGAVNGYLKKNCCVKSLSSLRSRQAYTRKFPVTSTEEGSHHDADTL